MSLFSLLLGADSSLEAETTAWLTEISSRSLRGCEPEDIIRMNTFIATGKSQGWWNLCDQIVIYDCWPGDADVCMINLKSPGTRNHTNQAGTNNYIYNRGSGFGKATASTRMNSNFIPSTHGVNYTQNACSILFNVPYDYAQDNTDNSFGAGGAAAQHALVCRVRNSSNNLVWSLNSATTATVSNTTTSGRYHLQRTASNSTRVLKNGSQIGSTSSVASTGLTSNQIFVNCYNNNGTAGTASTKYMGYFIVAGSLSGYETQIDTALATYFSSIAYDAPTLPTFPSYSSFSSDLSSYITAISGLKSAYGRDTKLVWEYVTGGLATSVAWQGGILGANLNGYGIPSSTTTALRVTPSTNPLNFAVTTFGTLTSGSQKYGSGARIGNFIYCCPFNATSVAKINTSTNTITYFDIAGVETADNTGDLTGSSKWWGFEVGSDGKLYGIPYNATEVIVIDPSTDAITFIDTTGTVAYTAGNLTGTGKYDGGAAYGDYVFGSVSGATTLLRINVLLGTCSLVGSFPSGTDKYSTLHIGPNGYLYLIAYRNSNVLKIDPNDYSYTTITGTVGGTFPYLISSRLMPNGKIVLLPDNADGVYELDTTTDTISKVLSIPSYNFCGAVLGQDGAIYGIPFSTGQMLKIFYQKKQFTLADNYLLSRYVNRY